MPTGGQWLYEYGREINRLTNRQLRAILGREPSTRQRAESRSWDFNRQILFLGIPGLAILLLALWGIRRYGVLLLAALRSDRSTALKIVAKIAAAFRRRGVQQPWEYGWVRWAEAIGTASGELAPHLRIRARRLLMVIQRLVYSDHSFRKRDLRFLQVFYLKHCTAAHFKR